MAIEIRSPHTGQPVRIRDEDVGRTVRDPAGNIFYVLRQADGKGYYASVTRAGGEKAEQTYRQRLESGQWPKKPVTQPAEAGGAESPVFDATGKRRRPGTLAKALFLVVVLAILVVIYLFAAGHIGFGGAAPTPTPTPAPAPADPVTPADAGARAMFDVQCAMSQNTPGHRAANISRSAPSLADSLRTGVA